MATLHMHKEDRGGEATTKTQSMKVVQFCMTVVWNNTKQTYCTFDIVWFCTKNFVAVINSFFKFFKLYF